MKFRREADALAFRESSRNVVIAALFLLVTGVLCIRLERVHRGFEELNPLPESIKKVIFPLPAEFRAFISDWAEIQSDQYFHTGDWRKIIPFLRVRAVLTPENTDAWSTGAWHLAFNLSEQTNDPHEKLRMIDTGMNFLAEGIRLHPDVSHLYFDLGWLYFKRLNNDWAALQCFKKSLSLHYDLRTFIWIGYIYERRGMYQDEADIWRRALALYPNNATVKKHYEAALEALKNQKTKES